MYVCRGSYEIIKTRDCVSRLEVENGPINIAGLSGNPEFFRCNVMPGLILYDVLAHWR